MEDEEARAAETQTAASPPPGVGRREEGTAREMAGPTGLPAPPSPAHTLMPSEAFSANTKEERSIHKWMLHLSPIILHSLHT